MNVEAKMFIGAQLEDLRGQNNTPIFTPSEVTDLLLDIWLLLDTDYTEEELASPAEVAAAALQGFAAVT